MRDAPYRKITRYSMRYRHALLESGVRVPGAYVCELECGHTVTRKVSRGLPRCMRVKCAECARAEYMDRRVDEESTGENREESEVEP